MQLRRAKWTNLNGKWEFAIDAAAVWTSPGEVEFDRTILVPFAPETPASGVNQTGFYDAVWYRRTFSPPQLDNGQRLILHLGAVDHHASVWVNDSLAVTHEGGYTPFCADITDLLTSQGGRARLLPSRYSHARNHSARREPRASGAGEQTIVVRAFDDPQDLAKPRGKQDWRLDPHSIWYYRTTGIWQTVWMEIVPRTRIETIRWTPQMDRWSIDLRATIAGPITEAARLRLRIKLSSKNRPLAQDVYSISQREVARTITIPDGGIDDYRNDLLWSPGAPNLIDADLELIDDGERTIDSVQSYTAMRSVAAEGDRILLNGRPIELRMVLDQGYWSETGLSAPDDAALRRDVELVKQLGFNGVRKHQKIEDPRFLYWADVLGLLVWEEMPSGYRFSDETVRRVSAEWLAAMARDVSHPCIIAWVPFNESWGVPDLPHVAAQREFVRGVYHLTKTFDPSRPVIGNDGWEMVVSDIVAIHDYDASPERIRQRYARTAQNLADLWAHERPGHRRLLLDGFTAAGRPAMLTEFGGIAYHKDVKHTWGYRRAETAKQFATQYTRLLAAVRALPLFAGFCYTQFTDTYQEANGLVYMDRTPKVPIAQIAKATSG